MSILIYDNYVLINIGAILISFTFFSDNIENWVIQLKFVHVSITCMDFPISQ